MAMVMTNTTALVAPLGATERMLGSNPLAVAIPGGEEGPVVIDFATSVAAYGKVRSTPPPIHTHRGTHLRAGTRTRA